MVRFRCAECHYELEPEPDARQVICPSCGFSQAVEKEEPAGRVRTVPVVRRPWELP